MSIIAESFLKESFRDEECKEVANRVKNIVKQIQVISFFYHGIFDEVVGSDLITASNFLTFLNTRILST